MGPLRNKPLDEAKRIINDDRNKEYGEPVDNFRDIADMITIMLGPLLQPTAKVSCEHVAMIMIAVKLSRMTTSPAKLDTWVDIAGYVGAGYEAMKLDKTEPATAIPREHPND